MLVYVDESGINDCLHREYGRALIGERVLDTVSGLRYERKSFIAAQVGNQIMAPMTFEGTCNTEVFNAWLCQVLVPELSPGQVVIMNNVSFHKSTKTRELIESAGCQLLYLPPYSPELNPIEKTWANIKRQIRRFLEAGKNLGASINYAFLSFIV